MTKFMNQPNADGLVKLNGKITGYHRRRETASFVFTETDQTKMGVAAIAAALAGLNEQAMGTAANVTSMEEEADHVQFMLNGQTVKGWVWRSPFKEGDVVEVAAEWQGDHYEAFGIARPSDKTIALFHIAHEVKHATLKMHLYGGYG
jgi:phage-related protein